MRIYSGFEFEENPNSVEIVEWLPVDTWTGSYDVEILTRHSSKLGHVRNLAVVGKDETQPYIKYHVTYERMRTYRYLEVDDLLEFIKQNTSESRAVYWDDDKLWFEYLGE